MNFGRPLRTSAGLKPALVLRRVPFAGRKGGFMIDVGRGLGALLVGLGVCRRLR